MGRVVTGKSPDEILQLAGDFFMKKDDVHQTMRRVTSRLDEEHIPYALIGGMAIGLHGYVRVTKDVDLLTTPDGLNRIHERVCRCLSGSTKASSRPPDRHPHRSDHIRRIPRRWARETGPVP
jgi:hypothetical protein